MHASFITPDALLAHWQGHRRLTRRVIDAFPDDQLFTFSLGGTNFGPPKTWRGTMVKAVLASAVLAMN